MIWSRQSSSTRASYLRAVVMLLLVVAFVAGEVFEKEDSWSSRVSVPVLSRVTAIERARLTPALRSVVDITATDALGVLRGTGVVLSTQGLVVTNNHVIADETSLSVFDRANHHTYTATVLGYDRVKDVAVLHLEGARDLAAASLSSTPALIHEPVFSVGNAAGTNTVPAITAGVVTSTDQTVVASEGLLRETLTGLDATTTAVVPGDSGGPLVTAAGRVLGLDVAGAPRNATNLTLAQPTTSYAVPLRTVLRVVRAVLHSASSFPDVHVGPGAELGVTLEKNGRGTGALVTSVTPHSPAARVGLVPGDIILSLGSTSVHSVNQLLEATSTYYPHQSVVLEWSNDRGEILRARVTFASGPPL